MIEEIESNDFSCYSGASIPFGNYENPKKGCAVFSHVKNFFAIFAKTGIRVYQGDFLKRIINSVEEDNRIACAKPSGSAPIEPEAKELISQRQKYTIPAFGNYLVLSSRDEHLLVGSDSQIAVYSTDEFTYFTTINLPASNLTIKSFTVTENQLIGVLTTTGQFLMGSIVACEIVLPVEDLSATYKQIMPLACPKKNACGFILISENPSHSCRVFFYANRAPEIIYFNSSIQSPEDNPYILALHPLKNDYFFAVISDGGGCIGKFSSYNNSNVIINSDDYLGIMTEEKDTYAYIVESHQGRNLFYGASFFPQIQLIHHDGDVWKLVQNDAGAIMSLGNDNEGLMYMTCVKTDNEAIIVTAKEDITIRDATLLLCVYFDKFHEQLCLKVGILNPQGDFIVNGDEEDAVGLYPSYVLYSLTDEYSPKQYCPSFCHKHLTFDHDRTDIPFQYVVNSEMIEREKANVENPPNSRCISPLVESELRNYYLKPHRDSVAGSKIMEEIGNGSQNLSLRSLREGDHGGESAIAHEATVQSDAHTYESSINSAPQIKKYSPEIFATANPTDPSMFGKLSPGFVYQKTDSEKDDAEDRLKHELFELTEEHESSEESDGAAEDLTQSVSGLATTLEAGNISKAQSSSTQGIFGSSFDLNLNRDERTSGKMLITDSGNAKNEHELSALEEDSDKMSNLNARISHDSSKEMVAPSGFGFGLSDSTKKSTSELGALTLGNQSEEKRAPSGFSFGLTSQQGSGFNFTFSNTDDSKAGVEDSLSNVKKSTEQEPNVSNVSNAFRSRSPIEPPKIIEKKSNLQDALVSGEKSAEKKTILTDTSVGGSTTTAAKPAGMGFSFGSSSLAETKPSGTGFSFGTSSLTDAKPVSPGFSFGLTESKPAGTGFSFGLTETKPSGTGISLGPSNTAEKPASTGFSFGTSNLSESKPTGTGFSFGLTESKPAGTGFSFGLTETKPAGTGFSFGLTESKPAGTGFSFGLTESKPTEKGQGTPDSSKPQPAKTGLLTGLTTAESKPTGTGFSFGLTSPAEKPASTGFSFGTSSSSESKPMGTGFSFDLSTAETKPTEAKHDASDIIKTKPSGTGFTFGLSTVEAKTAGTGSMFGTASSETKSSGPTTGFNLSSNIPDMPAGTGFSFAPTSAASKSIQEKPIHLASSRDEAKVIDTRTAISGLSLSSSPLTTDLGVSASSNPKVESSIKTSAFSNIVSSQESASHALVVKKEEPTRIGEGREKLKARELEFSEAFNYKGNDENAKKLCSNLVDLYINFEYMLDDLNEEAKREAQTKPNICSVNLEKYEKDLNSVGSSVQASIDELNKSNAQFQDEMVFFADFLRRKSQYFQ